MPYSKRFTPTPPARSTPFAQVELREAPVGTLDEDAFTQIDVRTIAADPTPLEPTALAYDVDTCTLEVGAYIVRFITAGGVPTPFSAPFRSPAGGPGEHPGWLPSQRDVAALMFARAMGEGEDGEPTFRLRPTPAQVENRISAAWQLLAPMVGHDVPEKWQPTAREVVVLETALMLEPSYWPEQQRDVIATMTERWEKMLERYLDALLVGLQRDRDDGPGEDGEPKISNRPLGQFPPPGNLYERFGEPNVYCDQRLVRRDRYAR